MGLRLNCKHAHRLASEGLDRDLTLGERTRLRAHLMLCDACHNFNAQMQLMRRAMQVFDATHQPRRASRDDDTWQ